MKKIYSILILTFILSLIVVPSAKGEGASLYLSPNTGTFFVGSTFNVSIFINTGGSNVNAVRVDLKFDPKKLQIASPTTGKSFISVWVAQPTYSNIEGRASFQGGVPSPGINTSSGLISTITFRVAAPGQTIISLLDSSRVLLDDGKGTNILTSISQGSYFLAIPPPQGPKVFSPTHPDQNKWYNNNNPTFSWEKESLVTNFSYDINHEFYTSPDNISEGSHTSVSYNDLEDSIWYFHVKAKKGGNWGGVSHYSLQIDTTPPAEFSLEFTPTLRSPVMVSESPTVSFMTTDNLSGISHYALKLVNLAKTLAGSETGFFVEIDPPHKMPRLEAGEYQVVVRAFDKAMNWQDASEKIEVIPIDQPIVFTKKGVNIFTVFLYWWKVALILLPLIAIVAGFILWWKKTRQSLNHIKKTLKDTQQKLERNGEEIKRKLNE